MDVFHGDWRAPKASRPIITVVATEDAMKQLLAAFGIPSLDFAIGEPGQEVVMIQVLVYAEVCVDMGLVLTHRARPLAYRRIFSDLELLKDRRLTEHSAWWSMAFVMETASGCVSTQRL